MKEVKYYEFITDESLTFSEGKKLNDYEYDPNLFNSLYDAKTSTISIITDYFITISD